jgi:hypothetical protein
VTAIGTLGAAVEALCGDLGRIRAPRGTTLNARSWATEAPLRMLLNNLDPEVAERPEELIVYGGSGKAARSHDALRALVAALLRLADYETLLVQSGKPSGSSGPILARRACSSPTRCWCPDGRRGTSFGASKPSA